MIGALIKQHRLARDISLRELGRRVDLSASYLSRLENDRIGGKAGPTESTCRKLAYELDIDADTLIAAAGRVPKDVAEIIRADPVIWSEKIRSEK